MKRIYINTFLIIIFTTGINYCQISFSPQIIYEAGRSPEVVSIGDVNNDGLNDVVVGTDYYNDTITDFKIFVFIQDNFGNLNSPIVYPYPKFHPLNSLQISDLNNDQLNDVVIAYDDSIGIYYQNNTGTLNPLQSFYSGNINYNLDNLSCGDLNYDGLTDIAFRQSANVISVMYQINSGGYTIQNYPAPNGGRDQIEVADVNNDQRDDVILMLGNDNNLGIHIFTQNNSGLLNNYVSYYHPDVNSILSGIAIGDINNDGMNDIVDVSWAGDPDNELAIRNQNPITNSFDSIIQISTYTNVDEVKIGDLNCDNRNEIIIAHGGWSSITIFEQDINNNYNEYLLLNMFLNTHVNHHGFCIGDINNDGRKDILSVCDYYGLVILINQSTNNEITAKPQTPIGDNAICFDGELTTYKTNSTIGNNVQWFLFPPESGEIVLSNKDSCQILWNNAWRGVSKLYVTATNSCGSSNSDTLYINIGRLPILNIGTDTTLCEKDSLEFNVGSGFTSYQWHDNSTDSIFIAKEGGKYYVEAIHICGVVTDTINITEILLPKINLPDDTMFCIGSQIDIDIALEGNNQYTWQDGSQSAFYVIDKEGVYTASIKSYTNCSNEKSVIVKEVLLPYLNLPTDTIICNDNMSLILDAFCQDCLYKWHDNDTLSEYSVLESGEYIVIVYNFCDTLINATSVEMIDCNSYLDVPSAFSPNEDGINDVLYAIGKNVENINFIIFDRWGEKVFQSTDLSIGWNGAYKGNKLESDVFMYYISASSTSDGSLLEKKGSITLVN
ncbi:MAG: hypothetical protein A2033_01100 [Bacteroidetes bacterium GWA2_31_9]|nr:MAG: hypothetical protein A2033_01100 [Bacteroidetes bacterium GWA2_31_9]